MAQEPPKKEAIATLQGVYYSRSTSSMRSSMAQEPPTKKQCGTGNCKECSTQVVQVVCVKL